MLLKLRKNKGLFFLLVISLFLFISCSKKEERKYVAKVGDLVLTQKVLNEQKSNHKFSEEYIHEWIERRLFYLDAVNSGVTSTDDYKHIIEDAKIEVAKALAIKKIFGKNPVVVTDVKLENYYTENISEFRVWSPFVIYNRATFLEKKNALLFRKIAKRQGWQNATEYITSEKINFSVEENKSEYLYNILPKNLAKWIARISKQNYSGIIKTSDNSFTIVQLVKKYNKDDVPEFEDIKEDIKEKYVSVERNKIYNNYLRELYAKYGSEIKR